MSDIFGPIVSAGSLEDDIETLIRNWIGTYLGELAYQQAKPSPLQEFNSYNQRPSGEHWPGDQLPALIIVNAGLEGLPRKFGDGQYEADWHIGLIVILTAATGAAARRNAGDYAAALRTLMVQKRGALGVSSLEWIAESYDEAPVEASRTMGGAVVEFVMTKPNILDWHAGPASPTPPPVAPGTQWSDVEHPILTVTEKS